MKNTLGLILLAIVCVGLGIALVTSKKQAAVQRKTDADTIVNYSNQWVETRFSLDEQKQVAVMLEKDLEAQKKVLGELTNSYTETLANLSKTEGTLKLTEEELRNGRPGSSIWKTRTRRWKRKRPRWTNRPVFEVSPYI